MTRRRLILAIVAAVLFGVAWWLSLYRLSAKERLLVGTWISGPNSGSGSSRWHFWPDRRCAYGRSQPGRAVAMVEWGGRWFIRDGVVVFDGEPSAVLRTVRPGLRRLGLAGAGFITYPLVSITDGEVVLVPNGTQEIWNRAPAD